MLRERIAGMHRAIVVDNNDPEGLLRVRVQIPSVLGEAVSNWAWPSVPNVAGQSAPDVQSPVWVAFEDGDIDRPVWMGTWKPVQFPNAPESPQNYILAGGTNVFPGASSTAIASQAVGDTFHRFEQRADGELRWGPGSVAADIILRRAGAGSLALTGGTLTQASVANLITDLATHTSAIAAHTSDIATHTSDIASLNTAVAQRALDSTVVHLSGAETITGVKTFSANPVFNNAAVPQIAVMNLIADLAARALDNTVVHLAGAESITGIKTFTANPVFNDGAIPQASVANLITDLAARAMDNTVVHLAGAESITGVKTFSSNPVFNDAAIPQAKVVNLVTDLAARAMDNAVVHLSLAETITGVKTFSANPVFNDGAIPQAKVVNLITDLASKAPVSTTVTTNTTQTISGSKTYTGGELLVSGSGGGYSFEDRIWGGHRWVWYAHGGYTRLYSQAGGGDKFVFYNDGVMSCAAITTRISATLHHNMNDLVIYFRSYGDSNHYLGWNGAIDGPELRGNNGVYLRGVGMADRGLLCGWSGNNRSVNAVNSQYTVFEALDFAYGSDMSIKTDVVPVAPLESLALVKAQKPFRYRSTHPEYGGTGEQFGISANDAPPEIVRDLAFDIKGLSAGSAIALLWGAIVDLAAQVEALTPNPVTPGI